MIKVQKIFKKIAPIFIIVSLIISNIAPALINLALAVTPVNEYQFYKEKTHDNISPSSADDLVNKSDGSFNYSYEIKSPEGRNGLRPNLSLNYQSNNRISENIFGFGWSINIPYIERMNKTGVHDMYNQDYFSSSVSGELASSTPSLYHSKIENGDFLEYAKIENSWIEKDKNGWTYSFGKTAQSRQDDPNNSSRIDKWMVDEIRDLNDNFIRYEYIKDSGQIYPSKIFYTGHGNEDGIYEIEFFTEIKSDVTTSTARGFSVATKKRVSEIQIKINHNWIRKYELDFFYNVNDIRALLGSITESGKDENDSTLTLPPTLFTYQGGKEKWVQDYTIDISNIPDFFQHISGANDHFLDQGVRFLDVNGDGLEDIIQFVAKNGETLQNKVLINKGNNSGWEEKPSMSVPVAFQDLTQFSTGGNGREMGARTVDLNGDGLGDIIKKYGVGVGGNAYINQGGLSGWSDGSTFREVPVGFTDTNLYDQGLRFVEINGDGLPDLIQSYSNSPQNPSIQRIFINNGNGFVENFNISTNSVPIFFHYNDGDPLDGGVGIFDVNGDGLDDFVKAIASSGVPVTRVVHINQGNNSGWAYDPNYVMPDNVSFYDTYDKLSLGVEALDFNGDGLPDLAKNLRGSNDRGVYFQKGNGTGWTQDIAFGDPPEPFNTSNDGDFGVRIINVNDDTLPDIVRSYYHSQDGFTQGVFINQNKVQDVLSSITTSKGGTTKIVYKDSPSYRNDANELLNPSLPLNLYTTNQVVTDDGLGDVSTTTFVYADGFYYYNNPIDRKFAGFGKVTATDSVGNVTKTYFHQGNGSSTSTGEYIDNFSKIGKAYRTVIFGASDNLFSKTLTRWENYDLGNNRNFVAATKTVEFLYDGNATHRDKAESFSYDNSTGNVTQRIEWGEVSGNDDGSFSDIGTDKFTTDISYAASTTLHLLGLPSQETVTNQSAVKVKETKHYYDNLVQGQVSKGNETKREYWKTGTTYIDTEKSYNSYGLVTQEKDPRDKITSYSYDSENLYATTSTNPLNQITTFAYDYSSGKVASTTDSNGRTRRYVYDAFDRPKEEKIPDIANSANLITKISYSYTDAKPVSTIQKTNYLDANNSFDIYTFVDGMERAIQERKEAEDANMFSAKDYIYNKLGLLEKESLPYFSEGASMTAPVATQALYTFYHYDPLKRATSVENILGRTNTSYDNWRATTTDALNHEKAIVKDVFGNLAQVNEKNSSLIYTTNYEYDYSKDLTKIIDALSNVRNFTYDGLGRRLTAEDLHAAGDATFGTWSYTYDDAGNLTQTVDPKNQTIQYTYDDINRVSTENYTGQAGTEVQYAYDYCADGVSRLCAATTTAVALRYNYNALGGIKDEVKYFSATSTFITQYEYDRQNNQTRILYPDSSEVKYEYNTAGLLEKVLQKEYGAPSFTELVSDFDYSPLEQVSFEKFYNGLETKNIYDANELYRLKRTKTASSTAGFGMALMMDSPSPLAGEGWGEGIIDIKEKRTPNTKTFESGQTPDGVKIYRTEFYPEDIYYLDRNTQEYKEIDTTLIDQADGWEMAKAPYSSTFRNAFGNNFVSFNNNGLVLFFSPATAKFEALGGQKTANNRVLYPNALGNGLDIEVSLANEYLKKEIIISEPIALGDIRSKQYYEIPFKLTSNKDIDLEIDGKLLSETKIAQSSGMVAIKDNEGTTSYILPPYAKDANDNEISIEILYEKKDDGVYLTKKIPASWLETAAYPVRTDATLSYNTGTGDGFVSKQAQLWDETRNADAGSYVTSTPTYIDVYAGKTATSSYDIARLFLPFNTASLPDNADVLSAKLKMYVNSKVNNSDDGIDWLAVIQTSQQSTSGLVADDYKQVGVTEGIDTSERKDITNIATSQNLYFQLNATGISWISKTGYTKLGLREGHDVINSAFIGSANQYNKVTFRSKEYSTLYSPTLEVTYTQNPQFNQELTYTYDKVGNITKIEDTSMAKTAKTVEYAYDDLYRLTRASSTKAIYGSDYLQTYDYNAIGNITNKSDVGSYLYQGDQGSSYANPHAATNAGGMARTYDNNGNLLTGDAWYWTHIWDYNNRLAQSVFSYSTHSTSTYAYDHTGTRVKLDDGTGFTLFPNKYYNVKKPSPTPAPSPSSSPTPTPTPIPIVTKHVFANGKTIATVHTSSTTNIFITHDDHLGSTSIISDKNGRLEQTLDYFPFGAIRTNLSGENSFNEQRKFTGHEYDGQTSLTYMGARYYPGTKARFLSQDSAFLAVGNEGELQSKTKLKQVAYLSNPQFLNSYSYTINNPLAFQDKNGEFVFLAAPIVAYAPVWVPAAMGGIAFIGAGVQSWFMGQALGQAMEGNYQGANQSLENVQATGAVVGTGAVGLMEAGALMNPAQNYSSTKNDTKLLGQPINISKERLQHVVDRHAYSGISFSDNPSKFNNNENITDLIKLGTHQPAIIQQNGNLQRTFDVGRNIGIDRTTSQQTSVVTIITDKSNNLMTTFPGKP